MLDNITCADDEVPCSGSNNCVKLTEICDGMDHCPGGTDEQEGCQGTIGN